MRLSVLLNEMKIDQYRIINEKDFDNMSLLLPNRSENNRCVFLAEKKFIRKLDEKVVMVITTSELSDSIVKKGFGVCIVEEPRLLFFKIHNYLSAKEFYQRKSFKTTIGTNCQIASSAIIPENNVIIGNRVIIEDRVTLMGFVEIGDDTIIHSGSVVGATGNDFKRYGDRLIRTAQVGGVKLGNGVEIDQNCCIERPTFSYENTILGNETKIGALSFVSHGVQIGDRTQIKGMVNIAGYTTIGKDVFIGPGVTISNLISIGDDVHVTIGSVVASSVLSGKHVTGNFAVDNDRFMTHQMSILREL